MAMFVFYVLAFVSFSIGIVGLPNTGKSTLFKALTKNKVDIAPYPFTTISPNVGIVGVADERLKKIASIIHPEKVTETVIEFIDIAGLVKGAHKGEGLGNQFLSHIRNCDAIAEIIRLFQNQNIRHIEGAIDPERDIEMIKIELIMKDLESLENILSKLEKEMKTKSKEALKKFGLIKRIKESLSFGKLISEIDLSDEEKLELKEYQFLTIKPIVYLFNISEKQKLNSEQLKKISGSHPLFIDLKLEEEISELSKSEAEELKLNSQLDQLKQACYNVLDLITFFTVRGGKEIKAWTLKRSSNILEAAARIHSDFQERFIRAEVIPWQKLVESYNNKPKTSREVWTKAKELGQIKTVGKEYKVQDGDVIEFKI